MTSLQQNVVFLWLLPALIQIVMPLLLLVAHLPKALIERGGPSAANA